MAYIDRDKLIANGWRLERHGVSDRLLQVMSLADVPAADVAPKREIARDIIEEILKFRQGGFSSATAPYEIMSLVYKLERRYGLENENAPI